MRYKDKRCPAFLQSLYNMERCSISLLFKAVVGSSRISNFALKNNAFDISRSCFWLVVSPDTSISGSISTPSSSKSSLDSLSFSLYRLSRIYWYILCKEKYFHKPLNH